MNKHNLIQSTLISAVITVVFVVAITLVGELYKVTGANGVVVNPIKDFLKALHGHHWVGKSIWAVILFVVSGIIMYFIGRKDGDRRPLDSYVRVLSITLIAGTIILFSFFTFEYLE